tara:strand:+ start:193 stop:696 length:504 start_codon:yes stop_codon:yes gene_type:complete
MAKGLKEICIKAAKTLLGNEENMSAEKEKAINAFGNELSSGIIDWLTQQTFTITDMKAAIRVDSIQTQGPLTADVLPNTTVTTPAGVVTATTYGVGTLPGVTINPGVGNVTMGTKGVLIPKINLKHTGGQGGLLTTSGHAYIGANPTGKTNENTTKVKLLRSNVVME